MSKDSHLSGLLRDAAEEAEDDGPEQLPLLPLGAGEVEVVEPDGTVRRVGRPKGSLNRRNRDLARFIERQFGNPIVAAASVYAMPVDELATILGCSKLQALDAQLRAIHEVAPYVESKMPVKVNVDAKGALTLIIGDTPAEGETVDSEAVEVLENQPVSDDEER